ncbi:hypothetical protein Tel_06230 [Candidatus Tenderia electrophaga]|jgi:hypothetical protein|uniref:Uncharacterized protein n=1 Tax=Candidatus Tenderia electrophaga TaxID=1748243 RepID=A0A0S2TC95_9GAMM|nr:hypothetical protein Tel_06230 [Candidatus Tenderia electrophaga]
MAQAKGDESLSRQGKGFTVPASPFNAVKLDLALIIIIAVVLWLIHDRLIANQLGQFLLLSGYGLAAMGWIVFRTRRVARRLAAADSATAVAAGAAAQAHGWERGEE